MQDFTPDCLWIDGSNYLYRAFHALPPLTTADGRPTGALYGVLRMLGKLRQRFPATHYWAIAFDAPGDNARQQLFADYKAQRPTMPTELQQQIPPLREIIPLLGLPLLWQPGIEADDFIASLTKKAEAEGYKVLIASGDKDLLSLVNTQVQVFDEMRNAWFNREKVFEKFGVYPEQMPDYLSLVGDKSDNIPGVKGIGEKTASQLLQKYETIEKIWQHRQELTPRQCRLLEEGQADLQLAKQLVALDQDRNDLPAWPALRLGRPADHLGEVLAEFGIQSNVLQIFYASDAASEAQADPKNRNAPGIPMPSIQMLSTWSDWQQFKEKIYQNQSFAVVAHSVGDDPLHSELHGVALALSPQDAVFVPLPHPNAAEAFAIDWTRENFLRELASIFGDATLKKYVHHGKFQLQIFENYQIKLSPVADDVLLLSYLLRSFETRHDLETLAWRYLRYQKSAASAQFNEKATRKKASVQTIGWQDAAAVAGEAATMIYALQAVLRQELKALPEVEKLYENLELPLMPLLATMERRGILVQKSQLLQLFAEFSQTMQALSEAIFNLAGHPFNLNSPKQLQQVLFNELQLPILEKTPGGQPSTAEDVLAELALTAPIAEKILAYRSVAKLQSTYTKNLADQCDSHGRLHTQYQQAVTSTGRLSSISPNLQNIPIRHAEGRRIRQAFIAPPGFVLLAADYSQIELRLMAHFSQDAGLLRAFAAHKDIHRATAAEVFVLPEAEVSVEQRRAAKAINFGLLYGMSAFGLAKQLGVGRAEAQAYIDRYFERFQGVEKYMQMTRLKAAEQGYVETLFGRRLFFPDIKSPNAARRQAAERAAINAPLQGSAADLIKRAMLDLVTPLAELSPQSALLLQVHDELVLEVPENEAAAVSIFVKEIMEQADGGRLSLPLEVSVGVAANWDAAH